jgi:hypothetical protein
MKLRRRRQRAATSPPQPQERPQAASCPRGHVLTPKIVFRTRNDDYQCRACWAEGIVPAEIPAESLTGLNITSQNKA